MSQFVGVITSTITIDNKYGESSPLERTKPEDGYDHELPSRRGRIFRSRPYAHDSMRYFYQFHKRNFGKDVPDLHGLVLR